MNMKLSILICTIPRRKEMFDLLMIALGKQANKDAVEIICEKSETLSIGRKRNMLLQNASGDYVAFIDDDDEVSDNYIQLLIEGINKGVDCCSLKGVITTDGKNPFLFEHSLKYKEWRENGNYALDMEIKEVKYERYPNHLNAIRAEIAKQFKFPEKNHGEDFDWSKQLHESGLLRTEHYIEQPIYFYKFISKK